MKSDTDSHALSQRYFYNSFIHYSPYRTDIAPVRAQFSLEKAQTIVKHQIYIGTRKSPEKTGGLRSPENFPHMDEYANAFFVRSMRRTRQLMVISGVFHLLHSHPYAAANPSKAPPLGPRNATRAHTQEADAMWSSRLFP